MEDSPSTSGSSRQHAGSIPGGGIPIGIALPGRSARTPVLAEVWGDIVDLRHLGAALALCCAISLAFFLAAERLLVLVGPHSEVARTYSLLAGLLGCLTGGALCAYLFRPKRNVTEQVADPAWQAEVLRRIEVETGPLGSVATLPAATIRELEELHLLDLFRDAEVERASVPVGNAAGTGT